MLPDKNKIFDSGYARDQTYYALKKANLGYHYSNRDKNEEGKKFYAWTIYKLEHELGLPSKPLRELDFLALEFYSKNPQLFKGEATGEEVLDKMIEMGYTCGKRYEKKERKKEIR